MNKSEFIAEVAAKAGMTKVDAQKSVNAFIEVIQEQMKKGEKVALLGFGTFSVTQKAARTGINPKTKKAIKIPARKAVKFKAGSALDVNKK
ncbi:DNA-binding protein [Porphyromonas macacae]|uniref:DNA-binding protein n=1 Tax=Porphyromonas macacae TaxID=28115 RepID=A0A0A2EBL4_9PORP|nr:HU family DNA-binding protein [Porphyromonas macacae]KGN74830.1 DNA-binding protein [Porphyromonas macacae]SUB89008.1 DNA-binding protein HU [Porphyromonas macacae]